MACTCSFGRVEGQRKPNPIETSGAGRRSPSGLQAEVSETRDNALWENSQLNTKTIPQGETPCGQESVKKYIYEGARTKSHFGIFVLLFNSDYGVFCIHGGRSRQLF